jgi:hypothetical protein
MQFDRYIRKPFSVEAVQITPENIEEIAGLLGELKEKDGEKWILIDRRLVPNIRKAYIGWYITKLDENFRAYSPKVFEKEFLEYTDEWAAYLSE